MSKINAAVSWALSVAGNAAHGYDQSRRWGPDYDCSSFLICVWEAAGVPVRASGATYTGNMKNVFLACGFRDVTSLISLSSGSGLKKGDVVLNIVHHTAMCVDSGTRQLVMASVNEKGGISGGMTGDQTGGEIKVRSYYNYPWDCVLRYTGEENPPESGKETLPEASGGDKETGHTQRLAVDGSFGPACTRQSQQWAKTVVDGKISNQPSVNRKYLYSAWEGCWEFKASGVDGGSDFIRALQTRLRQKGYYKDSVDGWCGRATVSAWQSWLKAEGYYSGAIDGSMGPEHVRAWQRFLNDARIRS